MQYKLNMSRAVSIRLFISWSNIIFYDKSRKTLVNSRKVVFIFISYLFDI